MPNIYVVEDDENIRELVTYALKSNGFEAISFEQASDFWQGLKVTVPELVILDIMLPDEDGIEILKKLKRNHKKLPVIMLTAKSSEMDKIKGLDLGADDYVTKPFSTLELISRIKAVLRRWEIDLDDETISYKSLSLNMRKHIVTADGTEVILTHKEFELLQYLLQNKGNVVSRETIMDKIWGYDFAMESRTVDAHIKTLRQKLGIAGEYILTVRSVGYKIGD